MNGDRHWIYSRLNIDGTINKDFVDGVETFVDFACNHSGMTSANEIRCPCKKCRNRKFQELDEVRVHLFRKGFVEDYYQWDRHGEQYLSTNSEHSQDNVSVDEGMESTCPYRQMILDAAGPEFQAVAMEEAPNLNAQKFYDMLKAADEKLWDGCTKHTQMSVVARLLHMKSEHHFSERCFDDFTQLLQVVLPEDNKMVANFYKTKKLVQGLGLPVEKIDCCKNNCMIYWGVDNDLTSCKFCNQSRFKSRRDSGKNVPHKIMYYFPLSPRLQRLYASEATATHMRWHDEHQHEDGIMCHPSDSEAWKHFSRIHPSFASESRNVRLGLYSSWPVIVTPHNLPTWMCMKEAYMFLSVIVPGFFDSMEHLPIHLPYEAKLAGPLQYRWMYPFERFLGHLKKNFNNKAKVEGSICNAYLVEEASNFCSYYFEPHVYTKSRKVPRNDDGGDVEEINGTLSIFKHPGRAFGRSKSRRLTDREYKAAQTYILLNCKEMGPYVNMYIDEIQKASPYIVDAELDDKLDKHFAEWFEKYARENTIDNEFIKDLAKGPLLTVESYRMYFVNGFKFHTESHGSIRSTSNSGVCIKGTNYSESESDYYGRLIEILRLEYPGLPIKRTVLFKCDWFDPSINVGMKVHKQYPLVDVSSRRKLNKYEPFILAMQAAQVYYLSYPSLRRDKSDWLAVCKVKARQLVDVPVAVEKTTNNVAFQEDEPLNLQLTEVSIMIDESVSLESVDGEFLELVDTDDELSDDQIIESESEDISEYGSEDEDVESSDNE